MANFPPLKKRFLQSLDDALETSIPGGRFLDFGCGRGDVAKHLIRKYGFSGDLLETSPEARALLEKDPLFADCRIYSSIDEIPEEAYQLIIAFDVIEHVSNPLSVLAGLNRCLDKQGSLCMIVPYRASTWGWDDEFYGHLRRWSARGAINALESTDYEILRISDPTFPLYSLLRKLMLRYRHPPKIEGDSLEQSHQSPLQNSYGQQPTWSYSPFVGFGQQA